MKRSTVTLSLSLAAALAYAAYLQSELNQLRSAIDPGVISEDESAVVEVGSEAEIEGEAAAEMGVAQAEGVASAAAEQMEAAKPQDDRATRRQERLARMLAAFEDPQMRVDMIERQMERLDRRYAGFFKTLDLSESEMETLRALMAEDGVINWEMRMRTSGAPTEEEREQLSEERRVQLEVVQGEIAALLGEEDAAALQEYTDSLPYRGEVGALASSLSFTDTPLTKEQNEQLVLTLKEVSQSFEYTNDLSEGWGRAWQNVSGQDIDTYFQERAEYDALVLEAASETLSDAQLAAYAERQLAERERDQRQMKFMLENGGAGGRPPGGPRW